MRCEGRKGWAALLLAAALAGCGSEPPAPAGVPSGTAGLPGLVRAESGGLRVAAAFTGDEAWREAFSRPGQPRIEVIRALEPEGVAALVLVYSGPATTQRGFALTCRATVDAPEGRVFEGEPGPCAGTAAGDADTIHPSPFRLVLRGRAGQRDSRLRTTLRVSAEGTGDEIVLELPLDVIGDRAG